jgi:hypothetical protein
MGLIKNIGRSRKVLYGTYPIFEFKVKAYPNQIRDNNGLEFINGQLNTATTYTNGPTAGTISVAGTTVTLLAQDVLGKDPSISIAYRISQTAISGYTVVQKRDVLYLTSTTVGPISTPTVSLGTATGIQFQEVLFFNGVAIPSIGAQDDILVFGRQPITITVTSVGGTTPTVQTSTGTEVEQANGMLTYGSALTLTGGQVTITTPVTYVRLTTVSGNTQATIYITR